MISFQWITLSFLLVSGTLFAYLIPSCKTYPCNHDDYTWSRFIYCIKITWAYKYSSYANIC